MSDRTSRRNFLGQAGVVAASSVAMPSVIRAQSLAAPGRPGANDQIRIGIIGVGVRGKYLISNLPPGARVVALCDCAESRIGSALEPSGQFAAPLEAFRQRDAASCTVYQDYRRMLAEAQLDGVMISTPDHHHVLAAMLACQAGIDVYCEKPLSLTVAEGRRLVDSVKQHQVVLQVGSQQRTMELNRFACEFIRAGGLGKVSLVELPNYPGPMADVELDAEPIPEDLAWDQFCGPTPLRPHNRKLWVKEEFEVGGLLWRGWDLWQAYSGHLMTNWGGHSVDMIQYALGKDSTGPVEMWPEISELDTTLASPWEDKTPLPRSPAMQFCPVTMKYADGTTVRFARGTRRDIAFHGARGKLFMRRNAFRTEPDDLIADPPDPALANRWRGAGHVARPHVENWLECMRTRGTPNAPVEVGHRTATICHLANLARELGRRLEWDPQRERFVNDATADQRLDRPRRAGFELPT